MFRRLAGVYELRGLPSILYGLRLDCEAVRMLFKRVDHAQRHVERFVQHYRKLLQFTTHTHTRTHTHNNYWTDGYDSVTRL